MDIVISWRKSIRLSEKNLPAGDMCGRVYKQRMYYKEWVYGTVEDSQINMKSIG